MDAYLPAIWFGILGVLLVGYAILDGFDFGVGILHLFVAKDDQERRITINSIGPLWDGNEVWLVTFGGALFAAFPTGYAAVFSGFYTAFTLLLFALIFRAVSIEFRSKKASRVWRAAWDLGFAGSSTLAAFLFGVAVGNAIQGVPLDAAGRYAGRLNQQLNGFALLVGALSVSLFALHGGLFLLLRTHGLLRARIRRLVPYLLGAFVVLFVLTSATAVARLPHATANLRAYPVLWLVPALNVLALFNIPRALHMERPGYAFFSSACLVAGLVFLLGVAHFPNLIVAQDPANSLTVYNAASSKGTLRLMLWIAGIGMPLVISYTALVYWTFRGRVELDETSY